MKKNFRGNKSTNTSDFRRLQKTKKSRAACQYQDVSKNNSSGVAWHEYKKIHSKREERKLLSCLATLTVSELEQRGVDDRSEGHVW
jgi:putative IMPACT (imprinted ancient) family translation regulator